MRIRHFIHGLAILLFAAYAAPGDAGEAAGQPSAFVTELARKALLSANSDTLSSADRQLHFGGLLDTDFDVPRIASFVLGRHWQTASHGDRRDFTAVFREFMLRVYSRQFAGYNVETFRIVGQRAEGAAGTVVYTEISQPVSGQPVKVAWHVVDRGGYRIVDMSVAGVSMALTKRAEFASYLQRNGGDLANLIRRLKM
jgi:phospholipid transport system substrate-binding protein